MEFHPDPAEEEEEMRPLHLVLRNVLGKGGWRREGGQRRGDCLEVCVSILSRSLPVFLEIKDGRGGLASRPADASSEEGGSQASPEPCRLQPDLASFPTFPGLSAAQGLRPQRREDGCPWPWQLVPLHPARRFWTRTWVTVGTQTLRDLL